MQLLAKLEATIVGHINELAREEFERNIGGVTLDDTDMEDEIKELISSNIDESVNSGSIGDAIKEAIENIDAAEIESFQKAIDDSIQAISTDDIEGLSDMVSSEVKSQLENLSVDNIDGLEGEIETAVESAWQDAMATNSKFDKIVERSLTRLLSDKIVLARIIHAVADAMTVTFVPPMRDTHNERPDLNVV